MGTADEIKTKIDQSNKNVPYDGDSLFNLRIENFRNLHGDKLEESSQTFRETTRFTQNIKSLHF